MKINYNPSQLRTNPAKAFEVFSLKVSRGLSGKQKNIKPEVLYTELHEIGNAFEKANKIPTLNKLAIQLAEGLVNKGHGDFAGKIYSFLIKLNQNNHELVEKFATNGLAIAKRLHDPVHTMARAEDLRRIYSKTNKITKDKRISVLYDEKRALNDIIKNYESAKNRFHTVSRGMKPKENYEMMLCDLLLEIADVVKDKDPKLAEEELMRALAMNKTLKNSSYAKKIDALLAQLGE